MVAVGKSFSLADNIFVNKRLLFQILVKYKSQKIHLMIELISISKY